MTKELINKLDEFQEKIRQATLQINEYYCEIEKIMVTSGDNYKGSYVAYFDGDDYVFMKVETQNIRKEGKSINLQGPAIRLCDDPLRMSDSDDGIDIGSYDEHDGFSFGSGVLNGTAYQHIRKISKEDMAFVLDYYYNTMKENLL